MVVGGMVWRGGDDGLLCCQVQRAEALPAEGLLLGDFVLLEDTSGHQTFMSLGQIIIKCFFR